MFSVFFLTFPDGLGVILGLGEDFIAGIEGISKRFNVFAFDILGVLGITASLISSEHLSTGIFLLRTLPVLGLY
tara:strand:- start:224 stop:445 length:222 start_codon:yes stop_codon:yes gene_type:complete